MTTRNIGPFRADHVGSFLRPEILKDARKNYIDGTITEAELRKVEDEEIVKIVEKQKELGFTAVTDGEFRRKYWHLDFIAELGGIKVYEEEVPGFFQGVMEKLTQYYVEGPLTFPKDHSFLKDFAYMKEIANDHIAKQTIPGPNMIFHSGVITNKYYLKNPAYNSLDEVADAIVNVYKDIIKTFYDVGCRYLQLDDTSWGALFSDKFRQQIEAAGYDADEITAQFADITIRSLEDKPKDMAITLHICRGNFKSSWLYEGDYEPIAKELFSRVNVDAFFLEFDTERVGDFKPLRYVQNQKVVLGLITTKEAELEDKAFIKEKVEEATEYVNKDQLCLSPQCGFASTEEGNLVTEEDQWNKMKLVSEIASDIWE